MNPKSQQPKGRDGALSSLNTDIEALNHARNIAGIAPAAAVFDSVIALLTIIRVRFFPFCDDKLPAHMHPGLNGLRICLR